MLTAQSQISGGGGGGGKSVMSNANSTITLRLIGGEEEPRARKLRLPVTVGRCSNPDMPPAANNAVFRSEYLSRRHAEFFADRSTGQIYIKDLNSSNGTFLNGNQLKGMQPVLLQEMDVIQFGTEDEDTSKDSVVIVQVQLSSPPSSSSSLSSGGAADAANSVVNNSSPPIYSKATRKALTDEASGGKPFQQRITDVMRKLSTLGMQLSSGVNDKRAFAERLDLLEDAVDNCARLDRRVEVEDSWSTIHTRPSLSSALRIIDVYETVFLLLAMLFVYLFSNGYSIAK